MSTVNVRVRLFAILREQARSDSLQIELEEGATVADALARLGSEPSLADLLARLPVQMAVNRDYAGLDTPLRAEDELALIPPISGGAGEVHARITEEPLSLEALSREVGRPGAGAIVCFQGITREVERLDYEAYREMAEQRMTEILGDCLERHGLEAIAAEHRLGPVLLGEPGVIVAVSAAHRDEAFAGAREAIDRIKAEVPIWKRELGGDGKSRWVGGEAAPSEGLTAGRFP
jgi:molybdopterin synthase catalytic subunit